MAKRSLRMFLFLLAWLSLCSLAAAQPPSGYRSTPGYRSPAGTFYSPYFQFFRRNTGPFNQYLSFVRPAQNLQNTLQAQRNQLNLLQGQVRRIGEQEAIQQTGTNSRFMTHQPYFLNQNAYFSTR
jgi:hypothetical protein